MLAFKTNDKVNCYFRLLILEKKYFPGQRLLKLLSLLLQLCIYIITERLQRCVFKTDTKPSYVFIYAELD